MYYYKEQQTKGGKNATTKTMRKMWEENSKPH